MSPYAKKDYVSHVVHDHTSMLSLVEHKWNLPALTNRDGAADNLLDCLDLTGPPAFLTPPDAAGPEEHDRGADLHDRSTRPHSRTRTAEPGICPGRLIVSFRIPGSDPDAGFEGERSLMVASCSSHAGTPASVTSQSTETKESPMNRKIALVIAAATLSVPVGAVVAGSPAFAATRTRAVTVAAQHKESVDASTDTSKEGTSADTSKDSSKESSSNDTSKDTSGSKEGSSVDTSKDSSKDGSSTDTPTDTVSVDSSVSLR